MTGDYSHMLLWQILVKSTCIRAVAERLTWHFTCMSSNMIITHA